MTSFGGASVRLKPTTKNAHLVHIMDQPPRTLLVEPEFKKQVCKVGVCWSKSNFDLIR